MGKHKKESVGMIERSRCSTVLEWGFLSAKLVVRGNPAAMQPLNQATFQPEQAWIREHFSGLSR
jgi:hypothetical protein